MRIILQRVMQDSVIVDGVVTGAAERGLTALLDEVLRGVGELRV